MIQRLGVQAIVAGEPVGGVLRVGEEPPALAQHLAIERDQPIAEPDVALDVVEVAVDRARELVAGAVLVDQPRHLVRMADEVGRELGADGQVDPGPVALAQVEEPPRRGVGQDLVLRVPLEGDADELRLVAVQPELPHQLPDVVLGAPLDERDLGFTDDDAHRTRGAYLLPASERTPSLVLGLSPNRNGRRTKYVTRSPRRS